MKVESATKELKRAGSDFDALSSKVDLMYEVIVK